MRIWILIIGMLIVTYIPRALPAVLMDKMRFNKRFEKFLNLIPYTAMTALIFPGVLHVDERMAVVGIVGGLTAIVLAWFNRPVTVVVVGAVLADMLLYSLI